MNLDHPFIVRVYLLAPENMLREVCRQVVDERSNRRGKATPGGEHQMDDALATTPFP